MQESGLSGACCGRWTLSEAAGNPDEKTQNAYFIQTRTRSFHVACPTAGSQTVHSDSMTVRRTVRLVLRCVSRPLVYAPGAIISKVMGQQRARTYMYTRVKAGFYPRDTRLSRLSKRAPGGASEPCRLPSAVVAQLNRSTTRPSPPPLVSDSFHSVSLVLHEHLTKTARKSPSPVAAGGFSPSPQNLARRRRGVGSCRRAR